MKRKIVISIEVISALFVLAIALLWLRIMVAPVSLDFLRPKIYQVLKQVVSADSVLLGDLKIEIGRNSVLPEVSASELKIFNHEAQLKAKISKIFFSLKITSFWSGDFEPYKFVILKPTFYLSSRELTAFFAEDSSNISESLPLRKTLTSSSQAIVSFFHVLPEFKNFSVHDLNVHITDSTRTSIFSIPFFEVDLNENILIPGRVENFVAKVLNDSSWIRVRAEIVAFPLAQIARYIPGFETLKESDISFDGDFSLQLNKKAEVDIFSYHLESRKCSLKIAPVLGSLPAINYLYLRGRIKRQLRDFFLDELRIVFEQSNFLITGTASDLFSAEQKIDIQVSIDQMEINSIRNFWPKGVAENTRKWITNHIRHGRAGDLEAELKINSDSIPNVMVNAACRFSGLTVDYFPPMISPVNLSGRLRFRENTLVADVATGEIGNSTFKFANLEIGGMGLDSTFINIHGVVSGPVSDLTDIIYSAAVDTFIRVQEGFSETDLKLSFPLSPVPPFEKMNLMVHAKISHASVPDIYGFALDEVDFTGDFINGDLFLQGSLKVDKLPVKGSFKFDIYKRSGMEILVNTKLTTKEFPRFYIPKFPFLSGGGPATVKINIDSNDVHIIGKMDLRDALLSFDRFGYIKPSGDSGSVSVQLNLQPDGGVNISNWELSTQDFLGRGTAFILKKQNHEFSHYKGDSIRFAKNNFKFDLKITDSTQYDLKLFGDSLDLEPLYDFSKSNSDSNNTLIPDNMKASVVVNLKRFWLKNGKEFRNLHIKAKFDSSVFPSFESSAIFNKNSAFQFILNTGGYKNKLYFSTDDAALIFNAFDTGQSMSGGNILLTGVIADTADGKILRGHLLMEDVTIKKSSVLAELFSLASLDGINNSIENKGIIFDYFKSDYVVRGKNIVLGQGLIHSSAIGITFDGEMNLKKRLVYLKGTLIPVNFANSILNNVPILKKLVDEGGLFAFKYSISGLLDKPRIRVNPLSVITPGFTRNVFELFEKKPAVISGGE